MDVIILMSIDMKKAVIENTPIRYLIRSHAIFPTKSVGLNPINKYTGPTINISIPIEGVEHYRSVGDFETIDDDLNTVSHTRVNAGSIRYRITANDFNLDEEESYTYDAGETLYPVDFNPIVTITTVSTVSTVFTQNVDYRINNDKTSVEWLGINTPADGELFTVSYEYTERGYYIVSIIAEQLQAWIEANFPDILAEYRGTILQVDTARNISEVIGPDVVNTIIFDVDIAYEFDWSRGLDADFDGTPLETVDYTITIE